MSTANVNTYRNQPDEAGRFGIHGGRFVAETLMPLILNVESAYKRRVPMQILPNSLPITKNIISAGQARFISPSG